VAARAERSVRIWEWLDERLGIAALGKLADKKEVPIHKHTVG
jgi:hypothetical protein